MNALLIIISALILIPAIILAFEISFALYARNKKFLIENSSSCRTVILIPAHNETGGIANIINNILPQLQNTDEILVVADNCTDDTAIIAESLGVRVLQRFHESLRGKGYALDYGIQNLKQNPPDIVIVIDADCLLESDGIRKLVMHSMSTGRPVQGQYLMQAPEGAGPNLLLAEFAWKVKNLVRPLGLVNLGLPCPLMGSGMAFPWEILSSCDLASGEIVEDLKLGLDLMQGGHPPIYLPDVLITSQFAMSSQAQLTQRTRWEHGHLGMIVTRFPPFFLSSLFRADFSLMLMALDMAVPPLALLVLLTSITITITGIAYVIGYGSLPLILSITALLAISISIFIAWYSWGSKRLPLKILLRVPMYILVKIPAYFGFIVGREKKWVRTERDN